jgi:hypothetical protein
MTEQKGEPASLSPWWRHATILVLIAGFSVLSLVTVLTYTNAPPIPSRGCDLPANRTRAGVPDLVTPHPISPGARSVNCSC